MRIEAAMAVARHYGVTLDPADMRLGPGEEVPSPAALTEWLRESGLWAKAVRLKWKQLLNFEENGPVVLLFTDGSAGLLVGVHAQRNVVLLKDPRAPRSDAPVPVDELRLSQVWGGETLLVRPERGVAEEEQAFSLGWLVRVVMKQREVLRDIFVASITLTFLQLLPPLLVMITIEKVLVHQSMSTFSVAVMLLVIMMFYEMLIGSSRRLLISSMATRVDSFLSMHVFTRLMKLPLDFFEHNPAGDITYRVSLIYRIREFLTGRLLTTFIDICTLVILVPFLFYLSVAMGWLVVVFSVMVCLVVLAFLHPMRLVIGRLVNAEIARNAVLIETVHGIRTVKSLALEQAQKTVWDAKVAECGKWRLAAGRLSNWPQTLTSPLERMASTGTVLIGAFIAMTDNATSLGVGSLMAFMMLSSRVAGPLVSMAKLTDDFEDVRMSVSKVAAILNQPAEINAVGGGLRPRFAGAISFDRVTFTYPRSTTPALDGVTFEVPPGTMLGVVGKSGSGKSTLTRLLQGINREYSGFLKIDGTDLREINLTHLRRSFGVVLQENFLFRGSVRENIIGGRPGLTLEDVVRAARLAGAEEFIERMPAGYETWIEEGSPNLSGGQRQRLAIARALITDPRILILDEATSALDPESEALVNANLQRIATGRTMLIVSHRLSSLTECDQTLVLDRGTVMDMAPHKVLLERCTIYRQLWQQQNRHVDIQGTRHAAHTPVLVQGD
jgi:HlyB family type I secretion system ABC transporter